MVDSAGAVTLLLRSALDLITHFNEHIPGKATEVGKLKTIIESMIAHVEKNNDKDDTCEDFKIWVGDFREAILDVEDIITSCAAAEAAIDKSNSIWTKGKRLLIEKKKNSDSVKEMINDLSNKTSEAFVALDDRFANLPAQHQLSEGSASPVDPHGKEQINETTQKEIHSTTNGSTSGSEAPLRMISSIYDTLSYEQKNCFIYLGIFAEDSEIPLWKLTRLWIAEGFIHPQGSKSSEGIAEDYAKELVRKKLLIGVQLKLDGKLKTCRVDGVVRSFCRTHPKYLCRDIEVSGEGNLEPAFNEIKACRQICIISTPNKFLQEKLRNLHTEHQGKKLDERSKQEKLKILAAHSIFAFSGEDCVLEEQEVSSITDGLNFLRVLDINKTIKFSRFPEKITKLVLLKYVTLSCIQFAALPEKIYKLWNVQTLEVYTSSTTLEIKASSIWKMKQLRHFKTKASIRLTNDEETEGGNSLLTVKRLSPKSCTNEVFTKAKNIKSLVIQGELAKLSCNLETLEHLENLKLVNVLPRHATEPPHWFPKSLKSLVLSGTNLKSAQMQALGAIGSLTVLKFKGNTFGGDGWDAGSDNFPRLELLHIEDTKQATFTKWKASGTAFCNLKKVVLRNCMGLSEDIPKPLLLGLQNMQLLHMDCVSKAASIAGNEIIRAKPKFQVIITDPEKVVQKINETTGKTTGLGV